MISRQGDLSSGCSLVRVVSHQGGLSSGWAFAEGSTVLILLISSILSHVHASEADGGQLVGLLGGPVKGPACLGSGVIIRVLT